MTYRDVVKAPVGTAEEKHPIPYGGIESVAASRSEAGIQSLYLRHRLEFTRTTMVGKQRHGTCSVVGFQVNHDFPACPSAIRVLIIEIDRHGVVGQYDAIHKTWARILSCGDEINAAVLGGQVGVGAGGLVTHRGQHRAVAVGIVTHTETSAPPVAEHVDLNFDGTACGEVEREFRGGLMGGYFSIVRVCIVEKHTHAFVGRGLASATEIFCFKHSAARAMGTCHPAMLTVQGSIFRKVVEVECGSGLGITP